MKIESLALSIKLASQMYEEQDMPTVNMSGTQYAVDPNGQNHSHHYSGEWQKAMPELAWGTLLLFSGIILGYAVVITYSLSGQVSYPAASLICTYLCFASFTVQHDAGHGSIFKMGSSFKFLESIIGWIASLPLLVSPFRLFQKIHDRHHAFTNDPERDPDHFSLGTKWYQVLLNIYYMPIKYHVMALTTLRHIKIFRDTYLSTAFYLIGVFATLITLAANGYALEVLSFVLIPTVITVFLLVMFFDYVPHHPHKSQDRYHNTRIFPGAVMNVLLLGQNYHLIHHMYPRLPWYKYQGVFHKILPDLEAHGAPIEDLGRGLRPGFMTSPNARNLQGGGKSVNMLLKVAEVSRLTKDAVSLSFELPSGETLKYRAGQYITVSKWLAGEQQTRCYSLCASPVEGILKIGVRETADGLVSRYLNKEVKKGDELIVQGPFGDFIYPPTHQELIEALVLIAGGSGITPILSILETELAGKNAKPVHLINACRSDDSIMFLQHLQSLQSAFPGRLKIDFVIDDRHTNIGISGRLNKALLTSLLNVNQGDLTERSQNTRQLHSSEFYLCGPEGLKNMAVQTLVENNVSSNRVHVEQFMATVTEPQGELHKVEISLVDGQKHALNVASNQTVLEVAKHSNLMLPHACGTGTCGTCKFKVDKGKVTDIADSVPGITCEEQAAGFTLACQCKPQSSLVLSGI